MPKRKFDQEEYNKMLERFEYQARNALVKSQNLGFFSAKPTDPDYQVNPDITVVVEHLKRVREYINRNIQFQIEKVQAIQDTIKYFKINSPAFYFSPQERFENDQGNDRLLPSMYSRAIEITLEELTRAIKMNPEYWDPVYYRPLVEAFSKPEMYSIIIQEPRQNLLNVRTSGSASRRFTVKINAEEVAGTPEELASAVVASRHRLGYGDELQGERATNAWYRGLYQVAREGKGRMIKRKGDETPHRDPEDDARRAKFYYTILRARLESLQGQPAYWYLLNYGNANVDRMGDSDKGGTGRPTTVPTYFIERSEDRIEAMLVEAMFTGFNGDPKTSEVGQLKELERVLKYLEDDLFYMRNTKQSIERAESLARQIKKYRGLNNEQLALQGVNEIVKKVLVNYIKPLHKSETLTEKESEIVKLKLIKFAATFLAQQPVPARLYIISKDNVQLRIRTKKVIQDLQDELSRYSKGTDAMILARLFERTSIQLEEMRKARQAELRLQKAQSIVKGKP